MTQITTAAEHTARRVLKAFTVTRDLEKHLIAEQADAIAGPSAHPDELRERARRRDAETPPEDQQSDAPTDIGHSDPVPSQAARLGYYARKEREVVSGWDGINKALDHLERVCASAMSNTTPDPTLFDEVRCPGYGPLFTGQQMKQLGGPCGRMQERWRRADGEEVSREYCSRCRKAKVDDEREAKAS